MDDRRQPEQRRRVVLHPRTAAARRFDRSRGNSIHVRGHTVDSDDVDELVSGLVRSALGYLAAILIPIALLLIGLLFVPAVRTTRPFGLAPLAWFLVGPVTLFSITTVAFLHERRTARFESKWSNEHRETGP